MSGDGALSLSSSYAELNLVELNLLRSNGPERGAGVTPGPKLESDSIRVFCGRI